MEIRKITDKIKFIYEDAAKRISKQIVAILKEHGDVHSTNGIPVSMTVTVYDRQERQDVDVFDVVLAAEGNRENFTVSFQSDDDFENRTDVQMSVDELRNLAYAIEAWITDGEDNS